MKKIFLLLVVLVSLNTFSYDLNYVVCSDSDLREIEECVNLKIQEGYKPLSALHAVLSTGYDNASPIYFQALVWRGGYE